MVARLGLVGLTKTATALAAGTISCSNSRRFAPTSKVNVVAPVRLAPGRFKLATNPSWTGSPATKKTIGVVVVAALAASAEGVVVATMTATWRRTRSAVKAGSRSFRPSAQRYSIVTFWPSVKPATFRPRRNARNRSAYRSGVSLPTKPTTGVAGCARGASGNAVAAPKPSVTNSLRLTQPLPNARIGLSLVRHPQAEQPPWSRTAIIGQLSSSLQGLIYREGNSVT